MRLFLILIFSLFTIFAKDSSQINCKKLGKNFLSVEKECIEYKSFKGEDKDKLIVLIHGAWKAGSNTLATYAPFAENINLDSDITTVAIALPGYSKSTSRYIKPLKNRSMRAIEYASTKEYINFLAKLLSKLKSKYRAKELIVLAHSAGAMATATILGYKPNLINKAVLAGGFFNIHKLSKKKDLISAVDFIDKIPKNTKIVLIYGTKDNISKAKYSKEFYKLAKEKGLNVKLVEIKNAKHIKLDMQEKTIKELEELIK